MLRVFSRHTKKCTHRADIHYSRCRCPKWVYGVLPQIGQIRQSAGTRSWEQAQLYAREWEAQHRPLKVDSPPPINDREQEGLTVVAAADTSPVAGPRVYEPLSR